MARDGPAALALSQAKTGTRRGLQTNECMARKQRHDIAGLGLAALLACGCGSSGSGPAAAPTRDDGGDRHESGRPSIVLIVTDELPKSDTGQVGALADSGIRFPGGSALPGAEGSPPWPSTAIRSSLLTGLPPDILGFGHAADELSAVPAAGVKAFPELLRQAGYFTVRNSVSRHGLSVSGSDSELDRPLGQPGLLGAWDVAGIEASWRRGPGEPCTVTFGCWGVGDDRGSSFFAMFNLDDPPGMIERQVEGVLAALETDGLAGGTVVIALGTEDAHTSAIARWDGRLDPGTIGDVPINVLDVAPTVLTLAGVPVPSHMEGRVFLGAPTASSGRESTRAKADSWAWPDGTPPVAATPSGSPTGGVFHVAPLVELSCETEDATIIYTTERVAPFHWRLYTGPFRMRFWTLRFQCGRLGYKDSEVVTYDFDIE